MSILGSSIIAALVIRSEARSTADLVASIPRTRPIPVNSPISINTRDGDFMLSNDLAFLTTPSTTPVIASNALPAIAFIPFINPDTSILPESSILLKNSITLPGISPIFSPTTVTASVNLSRIPFLTASNFSLAAVTISVALVVTAVFICVHLLLIAVLVLSTIEDIAVFMPSHKLDAVAFIDDHKPVKKDFALFHELIIPVSNPFIIVVTIDFNASQVL